MNPFRGSCIERSPFETHPKSNKYIEKRLFFISRFFFHLNKKRKKQISSTTIGAIFPTKKRQESAPFTIRATSLLLFCDNTNIFIFRGFYGFFFHSPDFLFMSSHLCPLIASTIAPVSHFLSTAFQKHFLRRCIFKNFQPALRCSTVSCWTA